MSEIALKCFAANIGASLAILAVLALRKPVRAMFGASLAYALWLLVPLVALASLLPPRTVEIIRSLAEPATSPAATLALPPADVPTAPVETVRSLDAPDVAPAPVMTTVAPAQIVSTARLPSIDAWSLAALVWIAGIVVMLALQLRNQSRFMTDARRGMAGPAVAGFLRPHIVTPADFEQRFDARERAMILAHETVHLDRNDARINTLVALSRCLFWFNPLIHVAAHVMRIDQELACDAAVTERHPRARAVYASALLKAQLASRPLPLGCYWPPKAEHTLVERIEMLELAQPGKGARLAGIGALIVLAIGSGAAAWAARPPVTHYTTISVPLAADNPAPAPAPLQLEPVRDEPQQTPAPQPASSETVYDPAYPVYLRGRVERIDFGDTKYTVFVRASSIAGSEVDDPEADTRLWELTPVPFWGDRDAVNADLKDQVVAVRGYGAKNERCSPTCRLLTRGIIVPRSTALPPASASFGVTEVNRIYDVTQLYTVKGRVQRIEFSDGVFDAYVQTEPEGLLPARIFQVRSENRFPREEVERRLKDQTVTVKGWPARANTRALDLQVWSIYSNCTATCAMYGTNIVRDDDTRITPAGEQLAVPPSFLSELRGPYRGPRDDRLVLTGKIIAAKSLGTQTEFIVEEVRRAPTPVIGPRPGTVWSVYYTPAGMGNLGLGDLGRGWTGRTVTFTAGPPVKSIEPGPDFAFVNTMPFLASVSEMRECEKHCGIATSDIMPFD